MRSLLARFFVIAFLCSSVVGSAQILYHTDHWADAGNVIERLNTTTFATISSTTITDPWGGASDKINGLAVDPTTGLIYCNLTRTSNGLRYLCRVNPVTGVATAIGAYAQPISTICFDGGGQLWGVSGSSAIPASTLVQINKANAALTFRNPTFQAHKAIGYNENDGRIYVLSGAGGTATLSWMFPFSGDYITINVPLSGFSSGSIQSMAWESGNNFIVEDQNNDVFRVNTGTGVKTDSGNNVTKMGKGLIFADAPNINLRVGATNVCDGCSYNYGSDNIGTTDTKTWTIENTASSGYLFIEAAIAVGGDWSIISQPGTTNIPPGGSTTFTCRFTPTCPAGAKSTSFALGNNDTNENPYNVTLNGTAVDVNNPTFTSCPSNTTVNTDPGVCTAVVTGINATTSDNCSTNPITYVLTGATTGSGSGNVSGTTFNEGVTTVTYTVTDPSANSATCVFTVTVNDNENPVWTSCPSNVTVSNDAGNCSAVVTGIGAVASDNCGLGTINWALTGATTGSGTGNVSGTTFNVGTTTVTYNVDDINGNSATPCSFTVTVNDVENPVFVSCPSNVSVNNDAGNCSAVVGGINPTVSDNCSTNPITYVLTGATTGSGTGGASGTVFNVGVTTVTYDVDDVNGNSAASSCVFTVTVTDTESPVFSCPSNTSVSTDAGMCTATVTGISSGASDNCGLGTINWTLSGATTGSGTGDASGQVFNPGTTTVTYDVDDIYGNSATTCTFDVTVQDNEFPVWTTCPTNTTVSNDASLCSAVVTGIGAVASDNCGLGTINWTLSGATMGSGTGDASGQTFNEGTTTVTYDVDDANGNSAVSCTFDVIVNDTEAPTWSFCPTDQVVNTSPGFCTASIVGINATATDNCGTGIIGWTLTGATTGTGSGGLTGTPFNTGVTTVTYDVDDVNGNSATSCVFTVTVTDNEDPVATCQNITVTLDGTGNASITGADIDNGSSDNCGIASRTPDVTAFTCADIGANNVTLTVLDVNGNSATCVSVVTVEETEAPMFTTCPGNTTVSNDAGSCDAVVTGITAVASDNCGLGTINWTMSGATAGSGTGDASGQTFNVGTTTVTYDVDDLTGNSAVSCTFDVIVNDTELPVWITCPTNTTVSNDAGLCSAVVTGIGAVASDNCGLGTINWTLSGATTGSGTGDASGQTFNEGTTTVTYDVDDVNGNSAVSCTFDVIVNDTELPVFTACPTTTTVSNDAGNCDAVVTGLSAAATDNCGLGTINWTMSGATTGSGTSDVSGQTFNVGTTTVTYDVDDMNGNSAVSCTFDVIVNDTELPVFTACPADQVVSNDPGLCTAVVPGITGVASDNCGLGTINWTMSGATTGSGTGDASGQLFNIGTTTVTYDVDDVNGNSATTCTFMVTVNETELPVFTTCPIDVTVGNDAGLCSAVVSGLTPVATDNCGLDVINWTMSGATTGSGTADVSGEMFNVGVTMVTYDVDDLSGNSAVSCVVNVTVNDTEAPVPDVATLPDLSDECTVNAIAPTATDNCGGTITATTIDPTTYSVQGSYVINWDYDDGNGNIVTQTQNVDITDATPPMFTSCPPDQSETPGAMCQFILPDYTGLAVATDNCTTPVITQTPVVGTAVAGNTTITLTADDGNGNTAICNFDVILTSLYFTANGTPISCNGADDGTMTLVVGGGTSPYVEDWGTSDPNALTPGTHTVIVTDASGCMDSLTFGLVEPDPITLSYTSGDEVAGGDGWIDITPEGGSPSYSYIWSGPFGFLAGTEDISGLVGGTYTVTITDAQGCQYVQSITINGLTSVDDLENLQYINIYPNPTNGEFNVTFKQDLGDGIIRLVDIDGKVVREMDLRMLEGDVVYFDLSDLATGMYALQLMSNRAFINSIVIRR